MNAKQLYQRQQVIEKTFNLLRLQHKSLSTERTYLRWIGSYIDWLVSHGRGLADSRARMEAYLSSLARRGLSASTQNQAFNALLYLYQQVKKEHLGEIHALRAKRSRTLRTALSKPDTLALLDRVQDEAGYPTRLIARLLYGCGLRVSEPLNLRVKDLDAAHSRLMIRGAKGGKDRIVRVPCSLMVALLEQMKFAKAIWQRDAANGLPVQLPGELARKYPRAPFAWQWAFVFPAHQPCHHPRTCQRVRYRMHECHVQRAVKKAARALDLDALATPHVLRHCYATHVIESGAHVRDVQEALGHSHLDTTMVYVRPQSERVLSPLEV